MKKLITIQINIIIVRLIPPSNGNLANTGVVQGIKLIVGFNETGKIVVTNPQLKNPVIIGVIHCGMKNIGFNIIGTPNIIGSVILNKDGIKESLPNSLNLAYLPLIIVKTIAPIKPLAAIPAYTTLGTKYGNGFPC